jgi:hypothetical protein
MMVSFTVRLPGFDTQANRGLALRFLLVRQRNSSRKALIACTLGAIGLVRAIEL